VAGLKKGCTELISPTQKNQARCEEPVRIDQGVTLSARLSWPQRFLSKPEAGSNIAKHSFRELSRQERLGGFRGH
jgi:hypothetical protein